MCPCTPQNADRRKQSRVVRQGSVPNTSAHRTNLGSGSNADSESEVRGGVRGSEFLTSSRVTRMRRVTDYSSCSEGVNEWPADVQVMLG